MEPVDNQFGTYAERKAKMLSNVQARGDAFKSLINKHGVERKKMSLNAEVRAKAIMDNKLEENDREIDTANAVLRGDTMADLKEASKMGIDLEVSGDALARAKRGAPPKLHGGY
jgi:histidinol phosphatase-like enzyme